MAQTLLQDKWKQVFIDKVAKKTNKPVDIVESIIDFQFKDALEAVKTNHEIEFSGFGKFMMSQTKLKKKIKGLTALLEAFTKALDIADEQEKISLNRKIVSVNNRMEILKTKLK